MIHARLFRWSILPFGILLLLAAEAPAQQHNPPPMNPAPAAAVSLPDFDRLLGQFASRLVTVSSNAEAVTLFTSGVGGAVGLQEAVSNLKSGTPAGTAESDAVELVEALVRWNWARTVLTRVRGTESDGAEQAAGADSKKQLVWMTSVEPAPQLQRLMPLLEGAAWGRSAAADQGEHPGYDAYRAAVDREYPDVVGAERGWLPLVEREGPAVLKSRLISEPLGAPIPDSARNQMAGRYYEQRLRPLIDARAQTLLMEIERDAALRAYQQWLILRGSRDRSMESVGLRRLCGSWQWTIHNHRNHGEQKTVMVFAPPGGEQAGAAKPKEAVVRGDTVYLRWELPGGVLQEDSLLLIGDGKRLEGSFVNSGGAWGSITGKRVQTCKAS